ncbi:hypothetical protein, partial [Aeromonas bivalvium]|uniref:hypothetical protein n=2 Tax=Aeromonas bivalvium TaxID=440079 RepID=UPI0038D029A7
LNRLLESSLIFKGFFEAPTGLSALPLALSMEAHYREQKLSGKGIYAKKCAFLKIQHQVSIYPPIIIKNIRKAPLGRG